MLRASMALTLWDRLVGNGYVSLIRNAASLVMMTVGTSVLGFGYWWLAARYYPEEVVGAASALVSIMLFLGTFSLMGFGTLLQGELQRKGAQPSALISTALITVMVLGGALGGGFTILARLFLAVLGEYFQNFGFQVLFALGVSSTAGGLLYDQVAIGFLRGEMQLLRNILHSVGKILLLIGFSLLSAGGLGNPIFIAWIASGLLVLLGFTLCNQTERHAWYEKPQLAILKTFKGAALAHHTLNLTVQASGQILPLIVVMFLSARVNAYFYIAWMICNFAFILSSTLTTVLYPVCAANPAKLPEKARSTLKLSLVAALFTTPALWVGSPWILSFFGGAYAAEASRVIWILSLATFPLIVKNHYIAMQRIYRRVATTAWVTLAGVVLELSLATLGAKWFGLHGLCLGWLIALLIEGIFFAFPVANCLLMHYSPDHLAEFQTGE